jgi:integrase
MSPLQAALADYLTLRRALGYKLIKAERLLGQFVGYLEELGEQTITVEQALAWATLPGGTAYWHCVRLSAVRRFATYLKTIDPACEVPGTELGRPRCARSTPYIYSGRQLSELLKATASLSTPHRAATYRTLIGLLAVTGMRIGEAIRIDRDDLDLRAGLLLIRDTKFGKSRELPLHESTVEALRGYLGRADRPGSAAGGDAVFVSTTGARLKYGCVHQTFSRLRDRVWIEPRSARCRPRLHDYADLLVMPTWLPDLALGAVISA